MLAKPRNNWFEDNGPARLMARTVVCEVWYREKAHPDDAYYRFCCAYHPLKAYYFNTIEDGILDMQGEMLGHVPEDHWDQLRAIFALNGLD